MFAVFALHGAFGVRHDKPVVIGGARGETLRWYSTGTAARPSPAFPLLSAIGANAPAPVLVSKTYVVGSPPGFTSACNVAPVAETWVVNCSLSVGDTERAERHRGAERFFAGLVLCEQAERVSGAGLGPSGGL